MAARRPEDNYLKQFVATDSEHKIISDFIKSQNLAPIREKINFLLQEHVAAGKTVDKKKDNSSSGAVSGNPSTPMSHTPSSNSVSPVSCATNAAELTQKKKSSKKRPSIDEICSKLSAKKASSV
ncbi:unnamed protein product [Caenorhabditis brenneri]